MKDYIQNLLKIKLLRWKLWVLGHKNNRKSDSKLFLQFFLIFVIYTKSYINPQNFKKIEYQKLGFITECTLTKRPKVLSLVSAQFTAKHTYYRSEFYLATEKPRF